MPLLGPGNFSRGRAYIHKPGVMRVRPTQRQRAAATIQTYWKNRKARMSAKPSRLYSGRRTYSQTKAITNRVMANISEAKYQGTRHDCLVPVAKPFGTIRPLSYVFLNTGSDISAQHAEYQTPLNLFQFPKGTDGDERVGEYMYLRQAFLKLEVQATPIVTNEETLDPFLNAPVRCRLMVVKANRKNNKFGQSPSPAASLFIDTQNNQFGYAETGGSINLLMKQPINKRKWLVYKDSYFTLTPYSVEGTDAGETKYASGRGRSAYRCSVKLPVFKKTHFDDATEVPDDVDTQWFVILQCCREAHCFIEGADAVRPANIRMNVLGTTSALDN